MFSTLLNNRYRCQVRKSLIRSLKVRFCLDLLLFRFTTDIKRNVGKYYIEFREFEAQFKIKTTFVSEVNEDKENHRFIQSLIKQENISPQVLHGDFERGNALK